MTLTLSTSSIFLLSILGTANVLSLTASLRRICSSDGDFLLRSKEMVSFFTYRGYRLSSSENDPSEQSDKR